MDLLVARGNKQFKMATKHEIERNSQMQPRVYRKWKFLLLWATTDFKMAVKHRIERIPLRAHTDNRKWILGVHGNCLRGYIYIETKIIEIQNCLYKIPIVSINETKKQKQDMATKETHCCQGDKPLVTKEGNPLLPW